MLKKYLNSKHIKETMDDLYQQTILDHYKHPRNRGEMAEATHTVAEANQSCGDHFQFYLKLSPLKERGRGEGVIEDITFDGEGCAISTAAASLLTQELKGKRVEELEKLNTEYMQELIGAPVTAGRVKCLTLPAVALTKLKRSLKGGE